MALNPYESSRGRLRSRAEATRRQFLLIMGGLAAAGASLFGGVEVLRFMFPAATGNAPALFKTSFSFDQLTGGVVGGKAKTSVNVITDTANRVSVILDDAGIYAVLLICTHLGCTPNFVSDVVTGSGVSPAVADARGVRTKGQQSPNGWACPCHGSRYFIDFDQLLRPSAAADGLGQHRGHTRWVLCRRPRNAGRHARSRRQHAPAVAVTGRFPEEQRQDVRGLSAEPPRSPTGRAANAVAPEESGGRTCSLEDIKRRGLT